MGSKGVLRFAVLLASIGVASCFNFDAGPWCGSDCNEQCSGHRDFEVAVPASRADDVASVRTMGPCDPPSKISPVLYEVGTSGLGVCRITVSFRSGAPDFVGEMQTTATTGCCCQGKPTPASFIVNVPM